MPHSNGNGNDLDSDLEDLKDRSMTSSMVSLELLDGLNVLQKHKLSEDKLGLEEIQPNMPLPFIHAPTNPTSPFISSNNL